MKKFATIVTATALSAFAVTAAQASPVKPQPTKDKCFGISLADLELLRVLRPENVQEGLSGQRLEVCCQGHLHDDQDSKGRRLAEADRTVTP